MQAAIYTFRIYRIAGLPLSMALRRAAADLPAVRRVSELLIPARAFINTLLGRPL